MRLDDVFEVVLARAPRRARASEADLLAEDRAVELLQRRARVDPELLDERAASLLVGLERLGLPPRAVEREHQLRRAAARAAGARTTSASSSPTSSPWLPDLELRLDPLLEQPPAAAPRAARSRSARTPRSRSPRAARRARASSAVAKLAGTARSRGSSLRLVAASACEAVEVELARVDAEHVSGRLGDDPVGPEQLAQLRDEVLERRRRRPRRLLAPERVDQPVGRDRLARRRSRRSASSARCFGPPSSRVAPSLVTSSGPSKRKS